VTIKVTLTKQGNAQWKFRQADRDQDEWLPAKVPGFVHTDLRANGRIPDPFYGTHELDLQWIDKHDWEYVASFDVPAELLAQSRVELVFDGLDTFAEVSLNGVPLLTADNMFRIWRTDARPRLRERGNELHIRFRSPIREGLKRLEQLGYGLPATNDHSEDGGLGDKKVSVFARKAPYHYGWDWGPRFVTSGVWRDVRLEGWSGCRIRDLFIRQDKVTANAARITAVVEIEAECDLEGTLRLETDGHAWEQPVALRAGLQTVELAATIPNPRLWWCRGYGEPHLYTFRASLSAGGAGDTAEVRTGLRSLRLVRQPDEHGTTFYFELNGVPVFAKGANHIPNDSFVTEVTRERYRHEIASAAASNFNMLRVWGGGIYEADTFYDLCDEYGILVWQDFMFACSMYPGDEAFLANVRAEAADQIRRLRNHPCIALWCGNNEIDAAWSHYKEDAGWGWKEQYPPELREKIWADYEAIFHRILPEEVARHAPGADYWPSSPLRALTRDANQHATNKSAEGDIHYWEVWHAEAPFERYLDHVGRFMSEYGFQSFPEWKTVRSFAEPEEMELESKVMLAHQKNEGGNRRIKNYMDIYYREPRDFASFLYLSQLLQAEGMKTAIEAHRRNKPFCMGTLYWQINDCWPVASWSSMDYYGRWKAAQYYIKRSFRDVMLSIVENGGDVEFHAVSDERTDFRGTLRLKLYDFAGQLLAERSMSVTVPAHAAKRVLTTPAGEWLAGRNARRVVLVGELERDGRAVDTKEHYFVPVKELELEVPDIRVTVETAADGGAKLTLAADKLAKQVWIRAEAEGVFSDNFFDLVPGVPKTVTFLARGGSAAFEPGHPGAVEVRSLIDFIKPDAAQP